MPRPQRVPIVFLHGVGLGLLMYLKVIWHMVSDAPKDQPMIVTEHRCAMRPGVEIAGLRSGLRHLPFVVRMHTTRSIVC